MQNRSVFVQIQCDKCRDTFSIKQEILSNAAGKQLACPKCGAKKRVPQGVGGIAARPQAIIELVEDSPTKAIACPDCRSENCQRVEMAYISGTAHTSSTSLGTAVIFNAHTTADALSLTTTKGQQQTSLASQLAPPSQKKNSSSGSLTAIGCCFLPSMIVLGIALILLSSLAVALKSEGFAFVGIFGGALLCILLAIGVFRLGLGLIREEDTRNQKVRQFNEDTWPTLFETWKRKYICLKCGRTWIPPHLRLEAPR